MPGVHNRTKWNKTSIELNGSIKFDEHNRTKLNTEIFVSSIIKLIENNGSYLFDFVRLCSEIKHTVSGISDKSPCSLVDYVLE